MTSCALRRMALCVVLAGAACGGGGEPAPDAAAALPTWTYDSTLVFPADGSLIRPEDGVALPGERLLVTDQVHGLRLVEPDGSSRPFGDMAAAGYAHNPPEHPGGANGVAMEPGGTHVLVADVYGAGIYRVDVTTGAAEKVYQHRYGINTAVRDGTGAIWFTQSAMNTPEEGEARMWAAVEMPRAEGALFRLPYRDGRFADAADLMVDSLVFGNGLVIDETGGHLYVAETVGGRVLRYSVDLAAGTLGDRTVFLEDVTADNLELDGEGNLWVANVLANQILVVNTVTGARHSAFQLQTPEQRDVMTEFSRRGEAGESRMELLGPPAWAPLPGLITGMIVGPGQGSVYLTGLGNALLKLPR